MRSSPSMRSSPAMRRPTLSPRPSRVCSLMIETNLNGRPSAVGSNWKSAAQTRLGASAHTSGAAVKVPWPCGAAVAAHAGYLPAGTVAISGDSYAGQQLLPLATELEFAVTFEPVKLQRHRGGEIPIELPTRSGPHPMQHLQHVIGKLRSPRFTEPRSDAAASRCSRIAASASRRRALCPTGPSRK